MQAPRSALHNHLDMSRGIQGAGTPGTWEQQPDETSRAFAAFCMYRDMPPSIRSVRKVAQELGKSESLMRRRSARHRWIARASAFDGEQDRLRRAAARDEMIRMAERQARAGQVMQGRGIKRIAALSDQDVGLLTALEAMRLVEAGIRIERTARGEPAPLPPGRGSAPTAQVRIIEILRNDPSRIGPVVEALVALREALPEMGPGMDRDEPDSVVGTELYEAN